MALAMQPAIEPKVELKNVHKIFRKPHGTPGVIQVLDGISLRVEAGAFAAFLGPSGCGKSTLLRIIAGLEAVDQGEVSVDGRAISRIQKVGMVFQSYSSLPWLTVRENVTFGLDVANERPRQERSNKVDEMMALVGLEEFANSYPRDLSGGMRQRLALARALAVEPSLLLLDEPFGALDTQTRVLLQDQLIEVWANLDTTVCHVTHDVEEALLLADVIFVFSNRPAKVRAEIANPFPAPRGRELRMDTNFLKAKSDLFEQLRSDAVGALRNA
jgi:NitT/TauT family transport system ATP-binding protein